MKITQITERAKQVKAKDKMPKVSKPTHGHESPHPMQGKMVGEVKHKMSKQPNPVAKHSRNKSGAGAHKSAKDYDRKTKKADIKQAMQEQDPVGLLPKDSSMDKNLPAVQPDQKPQARMMQVPTALFNLYRQAIQLNPTSAEHRKLMIQIERIERQFKKQLKLENVELDEANLKQMVAGVGLLATLGLANLGLEATSAKNTPLGQDLKMAAQQGDPIAEYYYKNIDIYVEENDQRTLINLNIRYNDEFNSGRAKYDPTRDDVKQFLAKQARIQVPEGYQTLEESVGNFITEEEFDRLAEKKDACYHKVKSRYKVWPSAYASGALVQCRKKGAKNWGNSSKKKKKKKK